MLQRRLTWVVLGVLLVLLVIAYVGGFADANYLDW